MKIAVDCRYVGRSGIGRVCKGILDNLDYESDEYYLIGSGEKLKEYPANIVEDDTDPYSVKGLLSFDKKLNKICDCLIIPNFLIPFGVKIPVYSVMHDLIFLDMKETTKGFADRLIKRTLLKRCVKKSAAVACVSGFTLSRCNYYYQKRADKFYVNYPGLDGGFIRLAEADGGQTQKGNYVLFVGNAKVNKGLKQLIFAAEDCGAKLVVVGERDNFLTGLKLDKEYEGVTFTGVISDAELYKLVKEARFLVQPSTYEGFGSPPLEALYLGTQPILRDIPVFREVYGNFPVLFFESDEELKNLLVSQPRSFDVRGQIERAYNYAAFTKNLLQKVRTFYGR